MRLHALFGPSARCGHLRRRSARTHWWLSRPRRSLRRPMEWPPLGRVRDATGVPVKVLPGVEEARLTYLATQSWAAFSASTLLVLDIGGGSVAVAGGKDERPEIADSLPLGATRLTHRCVRSDPPGAGELAALRVHGLSLLGPLAERIRSHEWGVVCATSKTFRTLANVAEELGSGSNWILLANSTDERGYPSRLPCTLG